MSPIYAFSLGFLILCSILAVWRGGAWERVTAAVLIVVWIGTAVMPFDGIRPPWTAVALDGLVALFLLYLAVFSGRGWPIWAAAFQFLLMANHLAFIRFPEIRHWAYVVGYYLWGDAVMAALALGTLTRKHRVNTSASPQGDENGRR